VTIEHDPVTPTPPPDPPQPMPQIAPPRIFVPPAEVVTTPPTDPAPLQATTADPAPTPATTPNPVTDAPPVSRPAAQPGAIRSAVLADARSCALPAYPVRALRNGEEGTTTLALLVGADGRVGSARIEKSSGSRELDQAAIHALSLCAFKPAMNNGVAEAGWARMAYAWTLD
jgi:protein TonB